MSEMPEQIWAYSPNNPESVLGWDEMGFAVDALGQEYIRKDVCDAMLKAEREKALREAAEWCRTHTMDVPMNRQQRKYAGMYCAGEWHSGSHAGLGYEAAILALISEDKSNG